MEQLHWMIWKLPSAQLDSATVESRMSISASETNHGGAVIQGNPADRLPTALRWVRVHHDKQHTKRTPLGANYSCINSDLSRRSRRGEKSV